MRATLRSAGIDVLRALPVEQINDPRKEIILIRPDHLGDLLFVSPGLRRLRRSLPDWKLTLAVGPWGAAIAERSPEVDEVIRIPFPGFTREPKRNALEPYLLLSRCAHSLRARKPGAAVILRDDHWWGELLAHRAGIPHLFRLNNPADGSATERRHWVERNAEVMDLAARSLGAEVPSSTVSVEDDPLRWTVSPEEDDTARMLLEAGGIDSPYVVVHPGTGAPVKLWSAERWAAAASAVGRDAGVQVVLTGDSSETSIVDHIARTMTIPSVSLAGQTSIASLAAVYRRANLVVGVDSGPLHLAVAVGTPTIHLFGPSDIHAFGPWGDPTRHRVLHAGLHCSACGDLSARRREGAGCMLALSTVEVIATMLEMLSSG